LALRPDDAGALWHIGYPLIASDQPEQAIPFLEKSVAISNRSAGPMGVLVRAYAHAGRRAAALRLLEELKRRNRSGYVPAASFVNPYLGLGDNENALLWLNKACDEHSNIVQWLKVPPPLRSAAQ
jgi:tetratricopeptide (TPR) repeat protein